MLRTRLVLRRVFWISYAIILVSSWLVNGVLTGRGVVRYDPAAILGSAAGHAPVEDLAFGFALVLATLVDWVLVGAAGRRARSDGDALRRSGGSRPGRGR